MTKNLSAFLRLIRKNEGTDRPNGYMYLFGSLPSKEKLFDSFEKHPCIFFSYTNKAGKAIKTSAAGAYQITCTTWKVLQPRLNLPDFSPASQDKAAIELIREKGALGDINAGNLMKALNKLSPVWASLPFSKANQPTHSYEQNEKWFVEFGGSLSNP